jgi:hypothetical protein
LALLFCLRHPLNLGLLLVEKFLIIGVACPIEVMSRVGHHFFLFEKVA